MYLLALETCSPQCSVAIAMNGQVVYEESVVQSKHAECILPMIDKALQSTNITIQEITDIAVTNGPGSFTGVRTGLSVASGLALPKQLPIHTTSSLALLAYQGQQLAPDHTLFLTTLDARMQEIYYAAWQVVSGKLSLIDTLTVCPPADISLPEHTKAYGIGTGWEPYWDHFTPQVKSAVSLASSPILPSAKALAEAVISQAAFISTTDAQNLSALYVRDQIASPPS